MINGNAIHGGAGELVNRISIRAKRELSAWTDMFENASIYYIIASQTWAFPNWIEFNKNVRTGKFIRKDIRRCKYGPEYDGYEDG